MDIGEQIISQLGLRILPGEGGYFRETYRSPLRLGAPALPAAYEGSRSVCTAIYYLLTSGACSAIHKLPGDEVFHFYMGDPVEMLLLHPDGRGELRVLGTDLGAGMRPQIVVPGGSWQGARIAPGGTFALLGTTMAPGFEFADFVAGKRDALANEYPAFEALIAELTAA